MKKGFTLAEVLLTLSIIGVVAAMTIPTLLTSTNDAQLKTAWKKAYADMSQATMNVVYENKGSLVGAFPGGHAAASEHLKNAFKKELDYIKECDGTSSFGGSGLGSPEEGCWHKANEWKYFHGGGIIQVDVPGLVLKNGSLLYFYMNSTDCSAFRNGSDYGRCGHFWIDVNGFKGPNTLGRDIYGANIHANGLIPRGARGEDGDPEDSCTEGSTDSANTGYGCSALYLMNKE